jgi:hypothetical protein
LYVQQTVSVLNGAPQLDKSNVRKRIELRVGFQDGEPLAACCNACGEWMQYVAPGGVTSKEANAAFFDEFRIHVQMKHMHLIKH